MSGARRLSALACAGVLLVPAAYCAAAEPTDAAKGSSSGASSDARLSTPAAIKRDAHRFGDAVRRESVHVGHEVARGAREFKHSMQDWWHKMQSGGDHSHDTANQRADST